MALAGHGFSRAATSQQKSRALAPEGPSESAEPRAFMELTPDTLVGNSLERVELIMALEEAFDIEIPDEDAEKLRTVQDAVNYVKRKKGGDSN